MSYQALTPKRDSFVHSEDTSNSLEDLILISDVGDDDITVIYDPDQRAEKILQTLDTQMKSATTTEQLPSDSEGSKLV